MMGGTCWSDLHVPAEPSHPGFSKEFTPTGKTGTPPIIRAISHKSDKCENAIEYVLTETISDAFFEV